jgi:ADP-ribose pyrophosphatase YjhB (NUDIX family)
LATPGTVIAPIEKVGDDYYVRCSWEYRAVVWDNSKVVPPEITDPLELEKYIANIGGEWVLSVPGGFANFVNETANDTAIAESIEEGGIKVNRPIFTDKTFNRNNIQTKIHLGYSTFETEREDPSLGRDERIVGNLAVNIRVFESADAMVQGAVDFAVRELILKKR